MLGWLPTYFSYRIKITQNYHHLLLLSPGVASVVLSGREIDKGLARVALVVRRVAVITLHFI